MWGRMCPGPCRYEFALPPRVTLEEPCVPEQEIASVVGIEVISIGNCRYRRHL